MTITAQIPTGTVLPYAGDLRNPQIRDALGKAGWLPCFGQMIPVATYPLLYNQIVNTYGGDSQNFALPDLRGLFLRGVDPDHQLGSVQPFGTAPSTTPGMALNTSSAGDHAHTLYGLPRDSEGTIPFSGFNQAAWNESSVATSPVDGHRHMIIDGGDHETRPINVNVEFIIKAD